MANLESRGWDIPGGHVEAGERPADALLREVYEETGARISAQTVFGHVLIRLFEPPPQDYKYHYPDSYIALYLARIAILETFQGTPESREMGLFAPAEARLLPWIQDNLEVYEAALAARTTINV